VKRVSIGGVVRRRWTVITAVVVVALTSFAVYRLNGIFGSENTISRPSADSLENSDYNPKRVLFEVFGSPGSVATINYLDENAQPQRVDDVALPWSHLLTTTDPTLFADLRAQGDGDTIGCRITANGIVKDERSSNNVNGYISCLDKSA
jgi:Mycobacterium membrane protein